MPSSTPSRRRTGLPSLLLLSLLLLATSLAAAAPAPSTPPPRPSPARLLADAHAAGPWMVALRR